MNWIKRSAIALSAVALIFASCDKDDKNDKVVLGDKERYSFSYFWLIIPEPQKTFEKWMQQLKQNLRVRQSSGAILQTLSSTSYVRVMERDH